MGLTVNCGCATRKEPQEVQRCVIEAWGVHSENGPDGVETPCRTECLKVCEHNYHPGPGSASSAPCSGG